jgi:DNA-binding NarL/FixJ family response regulator
MKKRLSQPWTPEDVSRLRVLAAAGRSNATIAERLKRTEAAIRYKARKLQLICCTSGAGRRRKENNAGTRA